MVDTVHIDRGEIHDWEEQFLKDLLGSLYKDYKDRDLLPKTRNQMSDGFARLRSHLTPRQWDILQSKYGINAYAWGHEDSDVAEEFECTIDHVRSIIAQAFQKLRHRYAPLDCLLVTPE
ncbi:MAG: sigma factor-like helix-turn-helix DNA-binding protein [Patescibacteria group bacterium]